MWEETYSSKDEGQRSWTQERPRDSLRFVDEVSLSLDDAILDVGGGASRLVDELVRRGYRDVSVLDLSPSALAEARSRVTDVTVQWIVGDVTTWSPTRTYRLWHDRAVFHFLVSLSDQLRYFDTAARAIEPSGFLIVAAFSTSGPTTCSGLAVQRWSIDDLCQRFAERFTPRSSASLEHVTPWGSVQPFTWVLLQRDDEP